MKKLAKLNVTHTAAVDDDVIVSFCDIICLTWLDRGWDVEAVVGNPGLLAQYQRQDESLIEPGILKRNLSILIPKY